MVRVGYPGLLGSKKKVGSPKMAMATPSHAIISRDCLDSCISPQIYCLSISAVLISGLLAAIHCSPLLHPMGSTELFFQGGLASWRIITLRGAYTYDFDLSYHQSNLGVPCNDLRATLPL